MIPRPFLIGGKRGHKNAPSRLALTLFTSYKSRITSHGISVSGISGRNALIRRHSKSGPTIFQAGANERGEKRMRRERLRFEFRMELAADEPGMIGHFDDFDVHAVGRAAGDAESGARQRLLVLAIEFVAMAVALGNFERAVGLVRRTSPARVCRATRPGASCRPFRPRRAVRAICRSRDSASRDRIRCYRRVRACETWRAYSIVAHCMPRQMPKNGIFFSRAYVIA